MKTAPKNRKDRAFTIEAICDAFSLKRDAYYKFHKRFIVRKQREHDVVELVRKAGRRFQGKAPEN